MIKTILVPTDGSDHACKAVAFASDIASKYEARVQLLHVALKDATPETIRRVADVEKLSKDSLDELDRNEAMKAKANQATSMISISVPVSSELIEDAGNAVLDTAEQTAKEHGVTEVSRVFMHGDPVKCILSMTEQEGADVIVMGTRGLGDLKGLFVGSVSHKVSNLAPCTCIAVK